MAVLKLINHETVLTAVTPQQAIEYVHDGFVHYASGDWAMPAKVYLDAPPHGDFRAMPARGDGLAMIKWVTSFPDNPARGLPTVTGLIIVSDAETGEPLALVDGRAVTALRTGAVAAVASRAIARPDARTVGVIGCGLHGKWVVRCMAAAGYGPGVCYDDDPAAATGLANELGWRAVGLSEAAACDVVCTVTPGAAPVLDADHLRAGTHINALGADGPGKAELTPAALARCELFCDEWEQASHGGELAAAAKSGLVARGDVTELGWLLTGVQNSRDSQAITLFDSTGLAIQDLAICAELITQLRAGELELPTVVI